jgi:hypothetical protein
VKVSRDKSSNSPPTSIGISSLTSATSVRGRGSGGEEEEEGLKPQTKCK